MFSSLIFSHIQCTAEKAPGLGTCRVEHLPRNQLRVFLFSLYIIESYFYSCISRTKVLQLSLSPLQTEPGGYFRNLFCCFFLLPEVPQDLTPLEQFLFYHLPVLRGCRKLFVIMLFIIGLEYSHYILTNLHQNKCNSDQLKSLHF